MTTQYANASYQEIIDIHTESDSVSVVGIHTPCSDTPYKMLKGFWDQFKKFKYNGCSITMVPSATLPVDPLQVSYDAAEPTIDPRDTLNPIMFHGCHGDDMGAILNSLYSEPVSGTGQVIQTELGDSVDHNKFATGSGTYLLSTREIYESLYYRALTDKTWLKAHPQRGFRKNGLHPMVYQVASSVQFANGPTTTYIGPKGIVHNDDGDISLVPGASAGNNDYAPSLYRASGYGRPNIELDGTDFIFNEPVNPNIGGLFTPRLQRLGWMDTRQVIGVTEPLSDDASTKGVASVYLNAAKTLKPVLTPKIFMGMLMLPPAYKTMQHFRLILNHSFSFAKFRGASMQYDTVGEISNAYPYFNFSGVEDSKREIEPDPEKDTKDGDVKDGE